MGHPGADRKQGALKTKEEGCGWRGPESCGRMCWEENSVLTRALNGALL